MSGDLACKVCGGPKRMVGHCVEGREGLTAKLLGNRVELLKCRHCGALWCYASHGEAGKPAGIMWPHTESEWTKTYDLDDGVSLKRWHLDRIGREVRHGPHPCGRRICRFRGRKHRGLSAAGSGAKSCP